MVFVIIIMVESLVGKSEEKQPCTRSHYHKASSWQKSYVQMVKTIGFDPWAIIFSWVLRRRVAQITSFEAWSIVSPLFQKGLPVHIHQQQQQLVSINVSRPKPFSMSAYCIVLAAMGYGPPVHYYPRCVNSEYGDSLCTCVRISIISYRISSYVDEPLSVYGTLPPLNKKPIALSLFYSAWKCPMEYIWCYMANIDCPIHTSNIITFCFKNKYAWFFRSVHTSPNTR